MAAASRHELLKKMKSKQSLMDSILRILSKWIEPHLKQDEIRRFITKKIRQYHKKVQISDNEKQTLARLKTNLKKIGWLEEPYYKDSENEIDHSDEENDHQEWLVELENKSVIHNGVLKIHSGLMLDRMDEHSTSEYRKTVETQIEKLLVHVEVRRKKALHHFNQPLSMVQTLREQIEVSILFSRHARRIRELRFLNTALKMNDWLYSQFKNRKSEAILALYLLALSEQELSIKELLV